MPARQVGDLCKKGHAIVGDNVLRRGKYVNCRACWNAYQREYSRTQTQVHFAFREHERADRQCGEPAKCPERQ